MAAECLHPNSSTLFRHPVQGLPGRFQGKLNLSHTILTIILWEMSLNMTVIIELGGYSKKHRHAEYRGNAPNWHANRVCSCRGGRVSAPLSPPVHGGQHIQQYNWPRLWYFSPGCPVRCEHHGSVVISRELTPEYDAPLTAREPYWRRLRVLAGEGPSLVLQWVLHPEHLPAEQSSHSRAPWGTINKILPNRDDQSGGHHWSISWSVCV